MEYIKQRKMLTTELRVVALEVTHISAAWCGTI